MSSKGKKLLYTRVGSDPVLLGNHLLNQGMKHAPNEVAFFTLGNLYVGFMLIVAALE